MVVLVVSEGQGLRCGAASLIFFLHFCFFEAATRFEEISDSKKNMIKMNSRMAFGKNMLEYG